MHGLHGGHASFAPGLTPLTAEFARPGPLWVCYDRNDTSIRFTHDKDATSDTLYCVKGKDVVTVAKLLYYGSRILKYIEEAPVPPPP